MAARLADLLKRDADLMSSAVETGLVRREWLESPGSGEPVSTATPMEVLERWLERSVEQRPSTLAKLGLSTIQILSDTSEDGVGDIGSPARLAVAFTDLEGFTRFTATEGDEVASRLLAEHYKMVGPVVRSRGGRVATDSCSPSRSRRPLCSPASSWSRSSPRRCGCVPACTSARWW